MNGYKNNLIIKLLTKHINNNESLKKSFNWTYKTQKYELSFLLQEILYVLRSGICWRLLDRGPSNRWNNIYKTYIKLNKNNIFSLSYKDLLKKYLVKDKYRKKLFFLTDTSFIQNKNGKDKVRYNKYYGRKKGSKISIITNENGIPLDVKMYNGNKNDSKILLDHFKNGYIINYPHLADNCKAYFLADAGYDTKSISKLLEENKYIPLISINKRNTKDENKIRHKDEKYKKYYKKRIKVENTFCSKATPYGVK